MWPVVYLASLSAVAHDFWIEPRDFQPAVGDTVPVVLRVGEDFAGTSQPLIPDWFSDYAAYGPQGRQPVTGMIGDDPAGSVTVDTPGSWVVGYRSTRSFVELDPARFNAYLDKEGLEWVRDVRQARGDAALHAREYYSRCAKAIINSGSPDSSVATTPLGYRLELIPKRDPYSLTAGDTLAVRLLYESRPLANILVVAFTADAPEQKFQLRTSADGIAEIPLDRPGTWLVKAVHMIEVPATDTVAEWESFWASLTFLLPR